MIKKQVTRTLPILLKYPVHYCLAFITLCIICYIYVQTPTLHMHKKTLEYSSWTFSQLLKSKSFNNSQVQISRERKLVLLWTNYFSRSNWLPSTKELNCPIQECDVTSDRSLLDKSSGIILHWRNVDPADLPPDCPDSGNSSKACPILVLFNKEAPPNTNADRIRELNNRIHLVASYRKDSRVYAPYGKIVRRSETFEMPELSPNRSTVCWLVSNCQTQSNRETYVNTLKRYIDVDVYGKCGNNSCPHSQVIDCYRWLSQRCKFYLSFENSLCTDYSTEKLYYTMMTDMVPIVMGGDDYMRYLPSHSYINVADFASPEVLARYLKALDKDEDGYMAYFKWKKHFKAEFIPYEWFCDVCAWLHRATVDDLKPREDLISWWFGGGKCGFLQNIRMF